MGGTIPAAHTLLIDCDADCLESFYESTRGTWAAVLLRLISRTRFLLTLAIRWVWFDRLGISFAEIVERLTGHNRREAVACPLETRDDARDGFVHVSPCPRCRTLQARMGHLARGGTGGMASPERAAGPRPRAIPISRFGRRRPRPVRRSDAWSEWAGRPCTVTKSWAAV